MQGIDAVKAIKEVDSDSIIIALIEDLTPQIFSEIYRAEIYDYISASLDYNHLVFVVNKAASNMFAQLPSSVHSPLVSHSSNRSSILG